MSYFIYGFIFGNVSTIYILKIAMQVLDVCCLIESNILFQNSAQYRVITFFIIFLVFRTYSLLIKATRTFILGAR